MENVSKKLNLIYFIFNSGLINKLIEIIKIKNNNLVVAEIFFLSSTKPKKKVKKIDRIKTKLYKFEEKPKKFWTEISLKNKLYIRNKLIFIINIEPPNNEVFFKWILFSFGKSYRLNFASIFLKKNKIKKLTIIKK